MTHPYDSIGAAQLWRSRHIKWQQDGVFGAWIAEMDYPLAPAVRAALSSVADDGWTGYLPQHLTGDLTEATAGMLAERFGWQVAAGQVQPITDGLSGFDIAVEHFSPEGSAVIVPTPNYMPFFDRPRLLGRELIRVPMLRDGGRYRFDLDAIGAAFDAGAGTLILTNPHNPVGQVYRRAELAELAEVVAAHGGRVFSDEIHSPLTYPGVAHVPYASVNETAAGHCLTLVSAAKAWNVPGLKCAQMILTAPGDQERWCQREITERNPPSTPGVIANIAAYRDGGEWLEDTLGYLRGNRDLLADLAGRVLPGVSVPPVEGTYLAFLDLTPLGLPGPADSWLLEHARVHVTPGTACGSISDQEIRFNFAMPRPVLEQAFDSIEAALAAR